MINESILLAVLYVKSKLNLIINNELNSIVILKELDIQVLVHICKLSERGVGGR